MMNNHLHVKFPVTIGFDDLLVFQAFELFPSCALGTLELVIWVSADALVYCCVDPKVTIPECLERGNMNPYELQRTAVHEEYLKVGLARVDQEQGHSTNLALYRAVNTLTPFNSDCYYDRRFTQARQPARVATNIFPIKGPAPAAADAGGIYGYSYSYRDIEIQAIDIQVETAVSTITGFNIQPEHIRSLTEHYRTTPMVVPSEIIRVYPFTSLPSVNGVNCTLNLALNQVKMFIILFPRLPSDLTCFTNPMLSVQLRLMNRVFPERPLATNSYEFLRYTLENAQLDTVLQCTEAFENSIIVPPQTQKYFRDRSKNDNTQFQYIIPLERQSANAFFFVGVNSPSETITLQGTPIVPNQEEDIYLWHHRHNQPKEEQKRNQCPPQICLTSDSFRLFSSDKHAVYETTKSWNQVFKDNYPALYDNLLRQAQVRDPLLINP
ncbi:hypothetical protein FACS189472_11010 [Alphaproteobacteria bacterium]|nr:hypothetical protein FACS189472_11010 [Alphaproteobacteria bacterium]